MQPYINRSFTFDTKSDVLQGTTGGVLGIGGMTSDLAVVGYGKGEYANHLVISFRGTESNAGDILADGNVGLKGSYNGQPVHAGFVNLFNTIRPQLVRLFSTTKPPQIVHCVGHSLGGAIASLAADWIKARYKYCVHLYTFGSPRVGLKSYALRSVDRSYRCTHGADPVPMIPLWPFVHAGNEYRLDGSSGVYFFTHTLPARGNPGYVNTASQEDWGFLQQRSSDYLYKRTSLNYDRRKEACLNATWLQKVFSAMLTLLRDSGFSHVLQVGFTSTLTMWDMLARTMDRLAKLRQAYASRIKGILGHMNVMSGNPAINLSSISYSVIKWSFSKLIDKLYASARCALKVAG
ncbi:Lipase (class 3) [Vibrio sp. B1FLJ16]|uniref:lipase family protein n=1 Tax=Vibrio sp. B1FLJ16 TaxID=2751178 RepID=UPI001AF7A25F|nr:lipase family protein [Vibrio sp. B1FLJ16]CAD7823846.1 Lipase (class 3) [Vibrio sp. B1FLJ16]CAE6952902.1 Lipase (class 3) [Vibrio sp. B1FLJ16]